MTISKILVPTVLSPPCGWAAGYAAHIAKLLGSKLIFAHAGDCAPGEVEAFLSVHLGNAPHETVVRAGDPAEVITQLSRELAIDMILMPTHACGRFRRFLLGSVTAKVLHDASCPVLTGVHRPDTPPLVADDLKRIVCAVDDDESFLPVVHWVLDFTATLGSSLKVIHAIPAADETSDNPGEVELRRYLFRRAEEKFGALCEQAGFQIPVSFVGGPVDRVIRETVLSEQAGLAIIGRGHTQRELGRLRTHAYAIIRNSPCPIVSI